MTSQQFTATVAAAARGGVLIPVPFNPDTVWGTKRRHHIAGTVNHMGVRGVVEPAEGDSGSPSARLGCAAAASPSATPSRSTSNPKVHSGATSPNISPPHSLRIRKRRHSSTPWPSSTDAPTFAGSTPQNDTQRNAFSA